MKVAPKHENEEERIKYLESYQILDTPAEFDFEELTSLAAAICETPISLISLVDFDRQWFKSKVGLEIGETSRDVAFCAHAINQIDDVFIIEDASKDNRFFDNPLVTSDPLIIFYAGVVLKNDEELPLGTLCVIDHVPRKLSLQQINALKSISRIAINLLESRKNKIQQLKLGEQLLVANKKLEIKKAIIEKKNEEVLTSLRYAKRIQQAILPSKTLINEAFPESFLLYKPKEIISGDFYWFNKVNGFYFGAVVDCTGHGIPGALMSMIGFNGLNRIILVQNILEPSNILDSLNEFVIDSLKENESEDSITDGMDIALFRYNPANNELVFSSANRPVILIIDNEIAELKPNKSGIGGTALRHPTFQSFNSVSTYLKKGDRFYIFTDGVTDQFNKNGKKILTKRLKESLLHSSNGEMVNQEKLIKDLFHDWMGEEEQTDDMLFMGFEVPEKRNIKNINVYTEEKTDITSYVD
jgi:serine phosphatase RsbU (regulator of sigma subunit)